MLLAIDVGNTNIVVGVFDAARLLVSWRLLTLRERTADEVGLMVVGLFGHDRIELSRIDAAVMASVVPPLTPIMRSMVKRYFNREPLVVDATSNAGMPILYERPAEVGADRIANAIAAGAQPAMRTEGSRRSSCPRRVCSRRWSRTSRSTGCESSGSAIADVVDGYCREIEAYLCRKNDGHLIRVVGPSFELVSNWAAQGIPLKIAYRGIDRYFERYYSKGPRRRPVRI